ncbi:MAG TPA: PspA/IM30 family protein [Acidobacteriaceae bacterium]|nr:PspA/IM30 family protein [Acidobacteriaceae bacterium]
MALMERVTTLLRANLNDLIDKAEDPEKMLKQLVLDMENQLLQVKTQVAIAIADQHLLEKKTAEHESSAASWKEKATLAVGRGRDDLAREALDRALTHGQMGRNFVQQLEDQRAEAETLRSAFLKLQQKLIETRAQCDLLVAEHRRARTISRSQQAHAAARTERNASSIDRYKSRITAQQAANYAGKELTAGDSLEDRFAMLERDQQVEVLLEELKRKKELTA